MMNTTEDHGQVAARFVARIRPELVAGKLQAAHELRSPGFQEQIGGRPELRQVLWFVEWRARQPGGLGGLAEECVAVSPGRFSAFVTPRNGRAVGHTLLDVVEMAGQVPPPYWGGFDLGHDARAELENLLRASDEEIANVERNHSPCVAELMRKVSRDRVAEIRRAAARGRLPALLLSICCDPERAFPAPRGNTARRRRPIHGDAWFVDDLAGLLVDVQAAHAASVAGDLAQTEVTRQVFDELEFASVSGSPVEIRGSSRLGKTVSVALWCRMHPGRGRLVTVPEGQRERDFIEAHADALGIQHGPNVPLHDLRAAVKYVLRWAGLVMVYDEAHFLIPQRFSRSTPPARLNWVRHELIDRRVGCAFFATPQSHDTAWDRYVKHTRYTFEQWVGRVGNPLVLPESLSEDELLAVTRKLCPEFDDAAVELLAACGALTVGYLATVEQTAERARHYARQAGRVIPTRSDIDRALQRVVGVGLDALLNGGAAPAARAESLVPHRRRNLPTARARSVTPSGVNPSGTAPAAALPQGRRTPAAMEQPA